MAAGNLTSGPVGFALWRLSAPLSLGIFSVMAVGFADTFFLARLGSEPLAAAAFIFPAVTALASFGVGLSAGINSLVSRALGAEDPVAAGRYGLHGIVLAIAVGGVLALALAIATEPLFSALGASSRVVELIEDYMRWWRPSFVLVAGTMAGNAILRAHGRGLEPAAFMVASGVLNVALDPVLIFGWGQVPGMGVEGAGLATFIARAAIAAALLVRLVLGNEIEVVHDALKSFGKSSLRIAKLAIPAALSNATNPLGISIITAVVAGVGESEVAGFGAAARVQSLAVVPLLALSAGIGPVVGQNWGASAPRRAQRALIIAWGACLLWGVLLGLGLYVAAEPLAQLMTDGRPDAAQHTALYLGAVGWSLFGYGALITAAAALNARGRPAIGLVFSLLRIGPIYAGGAALAAPVFGFAGVVGAAVVANLAGAFGALAAARIGGLLSAAAMRSEPAWREMKENSGMEKRDRRRERPSSFEDRELEAIEAQSAVRPPVVFEVIRREGEEEMRRPVGALALSGVAAGIAIGFSPLLEAVLRVHLPDTSWRPLVESFGYTFGFLIVIAGQMQLFTENTITPVASVLIRPGAQMWARLLRIWSVVFVANLAGAVAFAAALHWGALVDTATYQALVEISDEATGKGFWKTLVTAIPAGWLIAALVWAMPTMEHGKVFLIVVITYAISIAGFSHVIAGSVEAALLVFDGTTSLSAAFGEFIVPATIGNIIGGSALFTLLVWGQIRRELPRGDNQRLIESQKEAA